VFVGKGDVTARELRSYVPMLVTRNGMSFAKKGSAYSQIESLLSKICHSFPIPKPAYVTPLNDEGSRMDYPV
jgi:hypothetical protein